MVLGTQVNNTDAEGRLTLADGLWFAQTEGHVEAVVDIATLVSSAGLVAAYLFDCVALIGLFCVVHDQLRFICVRCCTTASDGATVRHKSPAP